MKLFNIAPFVFGIILTTVIHTEGLLIDSFVKKLVDDLIANSDKENTKFGLPVLDPLNLTNTNVSLNLQEGVDIDLYLEDLTVTGLKKTVVDRAGGTLNGVPAAMSLAVRLFVPRLSASAHYETALSDNFTLDGTNDPLSLAVGDISVIFNIDLVEGQGNDTEHLYVLDANTKIDLGWVQVDIGNVLGDKTLGEVVNVLLDYSILQLVQVKEQDINDFVETAAKNLIDGKLTLADLIGQ